MEEGKSTVMAVLANLLEVETIRAVAVLRSVLSHAWEKSGMSTFVNSSTRY